MNRILHVSKTASGGRFIGFQLRHLAKLDHDLHLALPGEGTLADMARSAGVTVHVRSALAGGIPSAAGAVREVLAAVRPDLVHTHFVHSTLASRMARSISTSRPPVFFQVPGPLHLERAWSRHLDLRTASSRDHWGPACQWSRDRYLQSGVPLDRVHLAYYGKDLDDYKPDHSAKSIARAALGFDASRFIAVMVAHVYPPRRGRTRGIKGHEDFIQAIATAQRTRPEIQGVVVGGPRPGAADYYAALQRQAADAGADVLFLGARADVTRIYTAADLAVHPSLSENLGGAGESLLMEVPTITTDVGGFPDIVRPGISGWMVPPKSPVALAAAIRRAADDPEAMKQMARVGRGIVQKVGDAAANARVVSTVYESML